MNNATTLLGMNQSSPQKFRSFGLGALYQRYTHHRYHWTRQTATRTGTGKEHRIHSFVRSFVRVCVHVASRRFTSRRENESLSDTEQVRYLPNHLSQNSKSTHSNNSKWSCYKYYAIYASDIATTMTGTATTTPTNSFTNSRTTPSPEPIDAFDTDPVTIEDLSSSSSSSPSRHHLKRNLDNRTRCSFEMVAV